MLEVELSYSADLPHGGSRHGAADCFTWTDVCKSLDVHLQSSGKGSLANYATPIPDRWLLLIRSPVLAENPGQTKDVITKWRFFHSTDELSPSVGQMIIPSAAGVIVICCWSPSAVIGHLPRSQVRHRARCFQRGAQMAAGGIRRDELSCLKWVQWLEGSGLSVSGGARLSGEKPLSCTFPHLWWGPSWVWGSICLWIWGH